jgi:hypothetical protein
MNQKTKKQQAQQKKQAQAKARKQNRQRKKQEQRVAAPLAIDNTIMVKEPQFNGNNKITVRHREQIAQITGAVNFDVQSFPINPGYLNLFTWLSGIAGAFEKYAFKKFVVEYVARTAATTSGSVYIAMDYDNVDAPPGSPQAMASYQHMVEFSPWKNATFKANTSQMMQPGPSKYVVLSSAPTSYVGSNLTDSGVLYVATAGNNVYVGDLFVDYEVEFMVPQPILAQNSGPLAILTSGGQGGQFLHSLMPVQSSTSGYVKWGTLAVNVVTVPYSTSAGGGGLGFNVYGCPIGWTLWFSLQATSNSTLSSFNQTTGPSTGGLATPLVLSSLDNNPLFCYYNILGQVTANTVNIAILINGSYTLSDPMLNSPVTVFIAVAPPGTGLSLPFTLLRKSSLDDEAKASLKQLFEKVSKVENQGAINETNKSDRLLPPIDESTPRLLEVVVEKPLSTFCNTCSGKHVDW